MKFKLNYKQYSDLLNITNNVFFPVKNFVNKHEFHSILIEQKLKNNFFPFPIFFGLSQKKYNEIKDKKSLMLIYKSQNIAYVKKLKFFDIDKNLFGTKIFGKKTVSQYLKDNSKIKFLSLTKKEILERLEIWNEQFSLKQEYTINQLQPDTFLIENTKYDIKKK